MQADNDHTVGEDRSLNAPDLAPKSADGELRESGAAAQSSTPSSLPPSLSTRAERGDAPVRSNSAASTAMASAIGMGLALQSGSQDGLAAFAKTADGLTDGPAVPQAKAGPKAALPGAHQPDAQDVGVAVTAAIADNQVHANVQTAAPHAAEDAVEAALDLESVGRLGSASESRAYIETPQAELSTQAATQTQQATFESSATLNTSPTQPSGPAPNQGGPGAAEDETSPTSPEIDAEHGGAETAQDTLADTVDTVADGVEDVVDTVVEVVEDVVETVTDIVDDVIDVVEDVVETVTDVVEDVVDIVEDVIDTVGDTVGDVVGSVGDVVGGVGDTLGGVVGSVGDVVGGVGDTVGGVVGSVGDVVGGVGDTVGGVVGSVGDVIGGVVGGVLGSVTGESGPVEAVLDTVTGEDGLLGGLLGGLTGGEDNGLLGGGLNDILGGTTQTGLLGGLLGGLTGNLGTFGAATSSASALLSQEATDASLSLSTITSDLPDALTTEPLASAAQDVTSEVTQTLDETLGAAVDIVETITPELAPDTALDGLDDSVDTLLGGLLSGLSLDGSDTTEIGAAIGGQDSLMADLLSDDDIFGLDSVLNDIGDVLGADGTGDSFADLMSGEGLTGSLVETGVIPEDMSDIALYTQDPEIDSLLNDILGAGTEEIYGTAAEFDALLGGVTEESGAELVGDTLGVLGDSLEDVAASDAQSGEAGLLSETAIEEALGTLFNEASDQGHALLDGLSLLPDTSD